MDIKRSYYEDIELFKSNTILVWSILFLVFLGILPWLVKAYHLLGMSVYVLNLITINALVAIGLNILVGYTGQISMGHAGFLPSEPSRASSSYRNGAFHSGLPFLLQGLSHPHLGLSWDFRPFA